LSNLHTGTSVNSYPETFSRKLPELPLTLIAIHKLESFAKGTTAPQRSVPKTNV